jgi:hypothetical protein
MTSMISKWTKSEKGFFEATATGYRGELYRLQVERVPGASRDRAWDWATWRADRSVTRQGYARSAKAGIEAAERATTEALTARALTRSARPTLHDSSSMSETRDVIEED